MHTRVNRNNVIFLFAHQDDEFGVFGAIEAVVRIGGRVTCLYLTSGTSAGLQSLQRNGESIAVLSSLGVARQDIHFLGSNLGIPDGQLHKHLETAYEGVEVIVEQSMPVSDVFVLAWEGGHQDHDATHLVGLAIAQKFHLLERTHQFSVYNGASLPWILFRTLSPLKANGPVVVQQTRWKDRFRYLCLFFKYPSQIGAWVFLFPFVLIDYLFFGGSQKLQAVDLERASNKPHPGRLLYERRGILSYDNFVAEIEMFRGKHIGHFVREPDS